MCSGKQGVPYQLPEFSEVCVQSWRRSRRLAIDVSTKLAKSHTRRWLLVYYLYVSLLPPGLPPQTFAWTVSSELLGFWFDFFFIFRFWPCAKLSWRSRQQAHVNLPCCIVSYITFRPIKIWCRWLVGWLVVWQQGHLIYRSESLVVSQPTNSIKSDAR